MNGVRNSATAASAVTVVKTRVWFVTSGSSSMKSFFADDLYSVEDSSSECCDEVELHLTG